MVWGALKIVLNPPLWNKAWKSWGGFWRNWKTWSWNILGTFKIGKSGISPLVWSEAHISNPKVTFPSMCWYWLLWDPGGMTYNFKENVGDFLSGLFSFCLQNSYGDLYRGGWGWFSWRRRVTNFMNALKYATQDICYIPAFKGLFCMNIVWNCVLEWGTEDPGIWGHWEFPVVPKTSSDLCNDLGLRKMCTKASGKQLYYWRWIPLTNLKMLASRNGGWTFSEQTCKKLWK